MGTNLRIKLAVLVGAAVIVGLFIVPIASAHEAVVKATLDCNGNISYTVTSWSTGAEGSNTDVVLKDSLGNTFPSPGGVFNSADSYQFSGTFHISPTVTSDTLTPVAVDKWGDNTPGGTYSDQAVTVTRSSHCATTTVTSVQQGGATVTKVPLGSAVTDQATVTGTGTPTGTVTFTSFSNGTCAGTGTAGTPATLSSGVATSASSGPLNSAGNYSYRAAYNGDSAHAASTGACEPFVVSMASPTISTTAIPAGTTITATGRDLTDTATLAAGASPTGTIAFTLFTDASGACGTQVGTSVTASVSGNGSYTSPLVHVTGAGTYHWIASYSGDANNSAVTGACGDLNENVTVAKVSPTISTVASPASATLGGSGNDLTDTATLADGAAPTGLITFKLFADNGNGGCGSQVGSSVTAAVSGNGSYTSPSVHAGAAGSYHWIASYGGDGNNSAVSGACGDKNENVTLTAPPPPGTPAISITKSPKSQTVASGATANFTITVTNTGTLALSNVSVSDPLSPNCNQTGIPALASMAIGASFTYNCSLANVTAGFTNVATATGTGSNGQTVTAADSAAVTVTPPPIPAPAPTPHPSIRIVKDPKSQTIGQGGTAEFTITVTNTGDVTLERCHGHRSALAELRTQPRHPCGRPVQALRLHQDERERRLRERRNRDRQAADDRSCQRDGSSPRHGEAVHPAAAPEDRDRQEPEDPDAHDHVSHGEVRGRHQDDRDLRDGALHDQGHEHRRCDAPQCQRHRPGLAWVRQDDREACLPRFEDLHL